MATSIPRHVDPAAAAADCPIASLLDLLAGKWALPILYRLSRLDGPVRFGVLQQQLGRITQKELARHLRQFEALGLVEREAFPGVPPRVEYRVSPLGRSLHVPLDALAQWSLGHHAELERSRQRAGLLPSQPRGEFAVRPTQPAAVEADAAADEAGDDRAAGGPCVAASGDADRARSARRLAGG
jgi:DNA-binding HxlR family transcriptional regulator